jgi:hypothetical protein
MVLKINIGDVVRLKKKHPCGGYDWQVVRLGADIGIKCLKCQRRILLDRSTFERRFKTFISRGGGESREVGNDRIKELEEKLADLKGRWPAHSVPPSMWQQLEDLEEELEKAKRETQANN